jgi:hypothetical protein
MSVHAIDKKTRDITVDTEDVGYNFKVDFGETMVLHLDSQDFDYFEIIFEESWPPDVRGPLTGSAGKPVSFRMPDEESTYKGHIVFKKTDTCVGKSSPLRAVSCLGC